MTKTAFDQSDLPHNAIPFNLVKEDQYIPQLTKRILAAKENIAAIKANKAEPTFKNTMEALEVAGEKIDLVTSIFYNLLSADTNDNLQNIAQEMGPILSEYSNDISLDTELFARIEMLWLKRGELKLSTEQMTLLDNSYKSFIRNGARLNADQKQTLRNIDSELSKLSPQFSENHLKDTNAFELWITEKSELAGLPKMALEGAKAAAKEKGRDDAYLFTLHAPSCMPFLQYGDHRPHRETLGKALVRVAFSGDNDNQPIIKKSLKLREQRAKLLGYKSHAHFTLEERMAETPERVFSFMDRILKASVAKAKEEVKELEDFAASIGGPKPLQSWDFSYYSEKLMEAKYKFNSEELRPYFEINNVIKGAFKHAELLYGLEFKPLKTIPLYHPDVKAYEVFDSSTKKFISLFYADFHPRPSKNSGAWATSFRDQGLFGGEVLRPHAAIVCNFTKPTAETPSLLTHDEVLTLFHEFGHALHCMLSQCRYKSLSGTNVYWDFVELPSQVMENWVYEKESLDLFAKHYQTGEPIPDDLAKKIKDSKNFMAGYASLRQMTFAKLDMKYFTTPADEITDVVKFERSIIEPMSVVPWIDGSCRSCSFGHIFAGGYSAGYYSYKWAEVLDADTFSYVKETGLFNKETARKFRENILERGGTEHPMDLFKKFRGREPNPDELLKRDGLI